VNDKKEYLNLFSSNNHEQAYRPRCCYFNSRALVSAGLEARTPSAAFRPCRHKNTLLNAEQILLRNKFSNLLPIRDISSILMI